MVASTPPPDLDWLRLGRLAPTSGLPNWVLRAAAQVAAADDNKTDDAMVYAPLRLSGLDGKAMAFRCRSIMQNANSWMVPIPDLEQPCPGWVPLMAAGRFASNPSKESLSDTLEAIALGFDFKDTAWYASCLPWVISACLAAWPDSESLQSAAIQIRNGMLGEYADWVTAEKRWEEQGITDEDVLYVTDNRWPFDSQIAAYGFPLLVSAAVPADRDFSAAFEELRSMYVKMPPSLMRCEVASCILHVLSSWTRATASSAVTIGDELLQDIARDAMQAYQHPFELAVFNRWVSEEPLGTAWTDIFDALGRLDPHTHRIHPTDVQNAGRLLRLLSDGISSHPDKTGILNLLAVMAQNGVVGALPAEVLGVHRLRDANEKRSAVLLRLTQEPVDEGECADLVGQIQDCSVDCPGFMQRVVAVVSPKPIADQLLLQLYRSIPRRRWRDRLVVINGLDKCLRRRTSALGHPQVWVELGLPGTAIQETG